MTDDERRLAEERPGRPLEERIEELRLRLDHLQAELDSHVAAEAARAAAAASPPAPTPSHWVQPAAPPKAPASRPPPGWGQGVQPAVSQPPEAPSAPWGPPAGAAERPAEGLFGGASLAELEERLTGRALAWVGGVALIVGAIFFLSLAFSRGWIGPEARVILGLAGGGIAFGLGAWLFEEARQRTVAHVLVAVGLGTISVALIAATRLYGLVPVELGLAASLAVAALAAVISIRASSQVVAGYGLLAVLAAPPLMGASPNLLTIAFLATALVGTTAIALFRAWVYLPGVAFVLSAPQLAAWIVRADVDVAAGLAVLAAFWLVNEVAAAGEEVLHRTRVLRPTTATLVLADAAFLVAGGFALLDGSFETYRGAFLLAVALAHFAVGGWFLRAEGDRHLFGLLVTGTGLAALTIAVPVQFGAPVVPIAWAAEGVTLAWIRVRRDHPFSGVAAATLGSLAVAHVVLVEMPSSDLATVVRPVIPFTDPAGLAAAFVVAALLLSSWIVKARWERATLIAVAVLLTAWALPFELTGVVVLVGWAALSVGAIGFDRRLPSGRPERPAIGGATGAIVIDGLESAVWYAGAVVGIGAIGHALAEELPLHALSSPTLPAVPFLDPGGLAIVVLGAAAVAIAFLDGRVAVRRACILGAGAIVAYGAVFEVSLAAAIVIWAGLAVAYAGLAVRLPDDRAWWLGAADVLVAIGAMTVLVDVAPPGRLAVDADRTSSVLPFLNGSTAALASLAAALAVTVRLHRPHRWTMIRGSAAGIAVVYLLSVGVVDVFQARVGGAVDADELAKQAQVALSVLWAILGAGAFAVGLIAEQPRAREAGLALLAVVTVKVFLVDLAALDVAYRVLSLLALGILLLMSAYLFGRFRPSHRGV